MDKSLWYDTLAGMPIYLQNAISWSPPTPSALQGMKHVKGLLQFVTDFWSPIREYLISYNYSMPISTLVSGNYMKKAPGLCGDSHCSYLNYIWHTSHNHFHQKFMHNKRIGQNCPKTKVRNFERNKSHFLHWHRYWRTFCHLLSNFL